MRESWAIGIDLGGTKLEVGCVDGQGRIIDSRRMATRVEEGPSAIEADIVEAVKTLKQKAGTPPLGIGIGMAGQIDRLTGNVHFAPNLNWRDVPLRADIEDLLAIRTVITNDVRAAAWGEWHHGAGRGFDDIVCLFVGTGIGGGVVSGGRMMTGCTNTAGELGHITIDLEGPSCKCGNRGCLEALAGGWAIARQAQEAVRKDREAGRVLLEAAGGSLEAVTAEVVARAAHGGDRTALAVLDDVGRALTAGCVSLVNAFNPCRLILGGGVIEGIPELIDRVRHGIKRWALSAASSGLEVAPSALGSGAGVIGSATLAMEVFGQEEGRCRGRNEDRSGCGPRRF